jgi:hypothetical protein
VPKFSICFGGILTKFNTKNYGIPLHNTLCFHFNDKAHNHILPCQALTPDWGSAWVGMGENQGKLWSVLAGCITANTTRKKSVSLLHCKATYSLRMLTPCGVSCALNVEAIGSSEAMRSS